MSKKLYKFFLGTADEVAVKRTQQIAKPQQQERKSLEQKLSIKLGESPSKKRTSLSSMKFIIQNMLLMMTEQVLM